MARAFWGADVVNDKQAFAKVLWSDAYSVGVAEMDAQHKTLLGMINQLADCLAGEDAGSSTVLHGVLAAMFDYTMIHFKAEECYLQRIGYPLLATHIDEHANFVEKMVSYSMSACGGVENMVDVHHYLTEWWLTHTLQSDQAYFSYLKANPALHGSL